MKAMIFAAGLGTRLKPLTDTMPKALVPVAGQPMLERVILRLKEAGVTDIVVNAHYLGEQIMAFLAEKEYYSLNIKISNEQDELLDTGGGILKASDWLDGDEPFLVHNADILTDVDLRELYQRHLSSGVDATLLVGHRETSRYLAFDEHLLLKGWVNKATGEQKPEGFHLDEAQHSLWAFNGVHVLSPTILKRMHDDGWKGKFSIIPFYLSICQKMQVKASPIPAENYWFDIGKMDTLKAAERHLLLCATHHAEAGR